MLRAGYGFVSRAPSRSGSSTGTRMPPSSAAHLVVVTRSQPAWVRRNVLALGGVRLVVAGAQPQRVVYGDQDAAVLRSALGGGDQVPASLGAAERADAGRGTACCRGRPAAAGRLRGPGCRRPPQRTWWW